MLSTESIYSFDNFWIQLNYSIIIIIATNHDSFTVLLCDSILRNES